MVEFPPLIQSIAHFSTKKPRGSRPTAWKPYSENASQGVAIRIIAPGKFEADGACQLANLLKVNKMLKTIERLSAALHDPLGLLIIVLIAGACLLVFIFLRVLT